MNSDAIFGPVLAQFTLTLVVWVHMYARRIPFILASGVKANDLTPAELARISPPSVSTPADNLRNLFELPVVFYAVTLYLYSTNQVDEVYWYASWTFVAFRLLHSAVHCTINIVLLRFWLYALSAAALWFMVIRALLSFSSWSL